MPVYKNISKATLILPRENGLKPDLELLPDRTFNGSETFYNQFVSENLIERQTDGYSYAGIITAGPDVLTVTVNGFIQHNGITATSADATVNSEVAASTAYSAFGKILWMEGSTSYEAWFSVQGDGTHGAGSTFSISAYSPLGAASGPIIAGSIIDIHSATIAFALAGATAINASVEVVYNTSQEGYRLGVYKNELLNTPLFSTIQTVNGDNQVTSRKIFYTGSAVGARAKLTTMTYTGTQTEPDTIKEELSFVTAADLVAL